MMDGVLPTLGFAERFVFSSVFTLHANERVDCLLLLLHRSIKSSSEASGQQKAACLGWEPTNTPRLTLGSTNSSAGELNSAQKWATLQEREDCMGLIVCYHWCSHWSAIPWRFLSAGGKGQSLGRVSPEDERITLIKLYFSSDWMQVLQWMKLSWVRWVIPGLFQLQILILYLSWRTVGRACTSHIAVDLIS